MKIAWNITTFFLCDQLHRKWSETNANILSSSKTIPVNLKNRFTKYFCTKLYLTIYGSWTVFSKAHLNSAGDISILAILRCQSLRKFSSSFGFNYRSPPAKKKWFLQFSQSFVTDWFSDGHQKDRKILHKPTPYKPFHEPDTNL